MQAKKRRRLLKACWMTVMAPEWTPVFELVVSKHNPASHSGTPFHSCEASITALHISSPEPAGSLGILRSFSMFSP